MKSCLTLLALLPLALAAYNVNAVVSFANANWNCGDAACTYRVSEGQFQNSYQCAEFVSRSITAGGAIPGLSTTASQSTFGAFPYKGRTYNLLWTSSYWGGTGLEDLLKTLGWRNIGTDCSRITAGMVVFTRIGGDDWAHVVIGVGDKKVSAHNSARNNVGSCFFGTPNAIYQSLDNPSPPTPPPANCKGKFTAKANGVNLRAAGNPTGTVLATLFLNDVVYDIVGTTTSNGGYNWRKVVSGSTVGFVNDNLLTNAGPCPTTVTKYCVTADPVLNLRDAPCTTGNRLAAIPSKNFVEDLGIEGTACGYTWRKVSYEGTVGYVADEYLAPCTPAGQYTTNATAIDSVSNCTFPNFPPPDQLYKLPTEEKSPAEVARVLALLVYLALALLA